jgi:eukaryotic-like serine/threonine-protein kinase
MSDRYSRLREIFDEVCELDEASRREILDRRCQGDHDLRREAERLLHSYERERAANAHAHSAVRRLGAWETIQLLGRGGMGEVWLARRADGQHDQRAAVKILSPYLAAPDSLDRFRRERQFLARLEHPNIARLLDGGMSQRGEPYLVMEYIEGVRLDRYCDGHSLSVPDRVRLFLKVCAAVHAAHQHFIVHRDLKPGNILVTAEGEPKLLDFGIAKVIDAEAIGDRTATTNLFLTPAYASPEILRGQPATVASDVYSLGVVLYELLSGQRPFDPSKLSPAGMMEAITVTDAPRPSSAAPPARKAALEGDLDSIVLKALAKNPAERYGAAAELAEDLRRHLEGQPVAAVHGSRWYVVRKFVRRNRLAVAAASALVLSLAAGLAGTLWQAHIARRERINADQRFNDARRLANYVLFDLYDSVGKIPGTLRVQADMESKTLEYLDRLEALKGADPQLRLEVAEGYRKLGSVLGRVGLGDTLGDQAKAIQSDRKALASVEPLVRENPRNLEAVRSLAAVEEQLGTALANTAQYDEAFRRLRHSAETFERIAAAHPRDFPSLLDAGAAWQSFGRQLGEKSGMVTFDAGAPRAHLMKSVGDLNAALRLAPANPRALARLAATWESIGRLESTPDPAKGLEDFAAGLALIGQLPESERQTPEMRQLHARIMAMTGWDRAQLGDLPGALRDLDEARPVLDELAAADPQNVGAAYRTVDVYRSLGLVHGYANHPKESLENFKKAVAILDDIVRRDPTNTIYPLIRGELQGRVANLLCEAGRKDQARPYAEASVASFKALGDNPSATPQQLIECVRSVAETGVVALRDYPAALRFALRADQLAKGGNPGALGYLAEAYSLNGDPRHAVESVRRGLAAMPPAKPGDAPSRLRKWLEDELADYQKAAAH